ncbi:hypothetical protein BD289DRAFT_79552 [Coniella lustricola]|uniref:Uncharacterized protein n=1 Tax=Coniella lustricola TaxID=2025994 RepID=A0A2T2ZZ45_9PEZI|nr:hypothetical protein BD289DRAFT_79552 [Coniella lustricola]
MTCTRQSVFFFFLFFPPSFLSLVTHKISVLRINVYIYVPAFDSLLLSKLIFVTTWVLYFSVVVLHGRDLSIFFSLFFFLSVFLKKNDIRCILHVNYVSSLCFHVGRCTKWHHRGEAGLALSLNICCCRYVLNQCWRLCHCRLMRSL